LNKYKVFFCDAQKVKRKLSENLLTANLINNKANGLPVILNFKMIEFKDNNGINYYT
jgi:hypothetical protein